MASPLGTDYDAAVTAYMARRLPSRPTALQSDPRNFSPASPRSPRPLSGRVGELLVVGNLVDANGANPLVVINQMSPIYATFSLPEQQLPVVLGGSPSGKPLRVEADLRAAADHSPWANSPSLTTRPIRPPARSSVQGDVPERGPETLAGDVRGRRRDAGDPAR